jgi:hypothetical protein
MTPEAIVTELRAAGVRLTIENGKIKATGNKAALERWLPTIRERKSEIIAALEAGAGEAARSVWWRLHFADREPLEIACTPPATRAEVLAGRHGVTAAEPVEPTITPPSAPLTPDEEKTIRRWLSAIGEHDETMIAAVIRQCQSDAAARAYFLERAGVLIPPTH